MQLWLRGWLEDPVWLTVAVVLTLIVIYYFVRWISSSRNYRDSADDHARSCLDAISFGCLVPATFVLTLLLVLVW